MKSYVVFVKPFQVVNIESYQGYEEIVTIYPGCALPVKETGIVKKTLKVKLPYRMMESPYSVIHKYVSMKELLQAGFICKQIYNEAQLVNNNMGISVNNWETTRKYMT